MNSCEVVTRAVQFRNPDRIPRQLWTLPGAYMRHGQALVDLLRRYPVDINPRPLEVPELAPEYRKGTFVDEWGSVWLNLEDGVAGEVKHPAVADWSALDRLKPPPLPADFTATAGDILRRRPDAFVSLVGGQIFERLQYLRGTENLYIDLMDQPPELLRLCELIMDHLHQRVDRCLKSPCHAVQLQDGRASKR